MGQSPSAKLGWGIDLGDEENDWGDGRFAPLGDRFHGEADDDPEGAGSFSEWADDILPGLYVDTAARNTELDAQHVKADAMIAAGQRAEYVAQHQEIVDRYAPPVSVVHYGYEFNSHALILARSFTWAYDWGSAVVDPASVAPPSAEEIGHLRAATESLGLTWNPADVELILMSQYS